MQCPIDKACINQIRRGIAALHEIQRELQLAAEAGIDCGEQAARCEHALQLSQAIIRVYEPHLRARRAAGEDVLGGE